LETFKTFFRQSSQKRLLYEYRHDQGATSRGLV